MNKTLNKFSSEFSINNRLIGSNHRPFIIAELSGNHKGDIQRALTLIEKAAATGVDAIKIQTYRPDTITLDHDSAEFSLTEGLWQGRTLYDLYQEAHTPWEWHEALFKKAQSLNVTLFSSPFDKTAIDLLENLNCPAYKIASFEITDIPLIKYAASTGKPIIMSTGMATLDEIEEASQAVLDGGGKSLAILHCVSGYPTPLADCNLRTISDLRTQFSCPIGLSDHSLATTAAITSVGLGASLIEKHFKLSENDDSVDGEFSLTPDQFSTLVSEVGNAWSTLGNAGYQLRKSEVENKSYRRSLYVSQDIKAGEAFSLTNIKSVRPGLGLHPRYYENIIGTKAQYDIKFGTPLADHHIDESIITAYQVKKNS